MNRRRFLALVTGGAGVLAIERAGLRVARGAAISARTVDRLVVTSVVDTADDPDAPGGHAGPVSVARAPVATPLVAERGLALHLDSLRGIDRREILFDFARSSRALLANYQTLRVDWTHADALVVSHGDAGHDGGLPALARAGERKFSIGLTVYAGGPDTFCRRVVTTPAGDVEQSELDRSELERTGLRVALVEEPTVLVDHAVTSGRIDRVTDFERRPTDARVTVGAPGSGCGSADLGAIDARPGDLVTDAFAAEHALAYHVKGRGLVVIVGCAHAGVVNTVRQFQRVTGIDKVHAIAGGFHLDEAPDEIVERTTAVLATIDPDCVVPMHCTGTKAIRAFQRALRTVVAPSIGTRVTFGT